MLLTTRCAVLGSPVTHSLSPVIHRAAYRWLGLDWSYQRHEVVAADFDAFLAGLDESWRGLSCTMPLKEVAAACGEADRDVQLTGAANTVILDPSGRRVYNTDISGFVDVLSRRDEESLGAAVLGNGATARSAVVALARLGLGDVAVFGRDPLRVAGFVAWAAERGLPARVGDWRAAAEAGLLVSTVPAQGVAALLPESGLEALPNLRTVFDAIYDPWPTPLAAAAGALDHQVFSGLELLVGQAVHQVRLMTGAAVPRTVLESAVRAATGRSVRS